MRAGELTRRHSSVMCFTSLLIKAANYLDIKGLLDVTCKTVANMIKGKTPEEIRKTFNIKNDFTEEEEAQVKPTQILLSDFVLWNYEREVLVCL